VAPPLQLRPVSLESPPVASLPCAASSLLSPIFPPPVCAPAG
jgi:hypothetical protein